MADIHVNYDNIKALLTGITNNIKTSINNIDLTEEQKDLIIKADKLKIDGDGNSYLSDNGTYKPINLEELETMHTKITDVYNMFKITETLSETTWTNGTQMITSRDSLSSCVYNNKIYTIGGSINAVKSNIVEIYDTENNTWATGNPLPISRYGLTSQVYNEKIYCIGGVDNNTNSNTVEIYDIQKNIWTTGKNMPTGKTNLTSQIYKNKIYVIGGYSNDGYGLLNTVEIYDIDKDIWTTGKNMPTKRENLTSCIYENKIYCIGGYNNESLNIVEIYDIENDTWVTGTPMTTGRKNLSSQIYQDEIYCIGGFNLNTVEVYNIKNDKWRFVTPMTSNKYSFTSQIIKNKIYCIGGDNTVNSFNNMEILNINSSFSYDITLPTELQSKIDIIKNDGVGNKLLADNGTYIEYIPSGYRELDTEELNNIINEIKIVLGGQ